VHGSHVLSVVCRTDLWQCVLFRLFHRHYSYTLQLKWNWCESGMHIARHSILLFTSLCCAAQIRFSAAAQHNKALFTVRYTCGGLKQFLYLTPATNQAAAAAAAAMMRVFPCLRPLSVSFIFTLACTTLAHQHPRIVNDELWCCFNC